ncbi:cellulose binding domain-containing protein [Dactylosporangium sp. CA-152071]|uniref:cellulose binding domain-containing protein n=1 Tax=Dactylosporangium sp. CA-152071 TaxID=3239933 RepID=UPI003D94F7D9
MHVGTGKRRALVAVAGLVAALLPAAAAHAAPSTFTPAATYNGGGTRYLSTQVTAPEGQYQVATNLWNPAVSGGFTMNYDTATTGFSVTNYTANSYFGTDPNTGPACTNGTDPLDPNCDWAGTGDPWVNPNSGVRDQYATTGGTAPFVAQQPPNDGVNHTTGTANEFSHQIHAPAAYPSIISGCHWGTCSPSGTTPAGAPFPKQTAGVARMDSVWNITVPATPGGNEAWDASYDIWFDSNCRPQPSTCATQGSTLPTNPQLLNNPGQNDGAEIMIWVNNQGYVNAQPGDAQNPTAYAAHAGKIQPAGMPLLVDVKIPGIRTTVNGVATDTTFDVWGGRVRSFDNGVRWNVISFVARTKGTGLVGDPAVPGTVPANGGFDSHIFTKYAASLDDMGIYCSTDPGSPITPEQTICLEPKWWVTSVQAGFEIWNLPQTSTLATTRFSVNPVAVSGGINTGGRATPDGTPLVHWDDVFTINATGCTPATSATWTIVGRNYNTTPPTEGFRLNGTLTHVGSGNYAATGVGPLRNPAAGYVLHDEAQVIITIVCNGVTFTSTGNLFIDPSGKVSNTAGSPISGATVTLYRSATQTGTYTAVPNGSTTIMSPRNRANPSLTNGYGFYRWDVSPGWYKVRVTKAGCTAPGSSQTFVESPAKQVSANLPPVTNLDLTMYCGEQSTLPATVVVRPPGVRPVSQGGYCADVYVTNNTGAAKEWFATFAIPAGQHISQTWNMVLTQQGATAVNAHADPANPWNKILQPGQTTNDVGFCTGP